MKTWVYEMAKIPVEIWLECSWAAFGSSGRVMVAVVQLCCATFSVTTLAG